MRTDPGIVIPFFELNGIALEGREGSSVRCRAEVRPWLEGTAALGVHGATLALADSVLSYAGSDGSPPGWMAVTLSMHLELWQASPPAVGSRLLGEARPEPVGGEVALVRGTVSSEAGTVATGTARAVLAPIEGRPSGARRPGTPLRLVPALEQVAGGGRGPAVGPGRALDHLLELPAAALFALEVRATGPGAVELAARADRSLERTGGVVHGGAVPILGDLAAAAALALEEGGGPPGRLSISVDYLRPTRVDEPLWVGARVVHRSRRLVSVQVEILNEEGKPTARLSELVGAPLLA